MDSSSVFRDRLRALLEKRGLKGKDLAEKANVYTSQLSNYLNGKSDPSLDVMDRIASAIGTEAWELIKPPAMDDQTPEEKELLAVFRRLNEKQKGYIIGLALEFAGESVHGHSQPPDQKKKSS